MEAMTDSKDHSSGSSQREVKQHGLLLAALLFLLVASPFGDLVAGAGRSFSILFVLVLVAAVFVNTKTPWIFLLGIGLGVGAAVGLGLAEWTGIGQFRALGNLCGLALLTGTTFVVLASVVRASDVSLDTIIGSICAYLLIGLCFAMVYILAIDVQPGGLARLGEPILSDRFASGVKSLQMIYFSFVTLTTLGYGDISPVSDELKMVAIIEAIIGQMYIGIFVARLITLHLQGSRAPSTGGQDS